MTPEPNLNYYTANADQLFNRYQTLSSEVVHATWKKLLPNQPGLACDIGAGSGRDACWLANKGWDVVAVEPCRELRQQGEAFITEHTFNSNIITWVDDKLPDLNNLLSKDLRYQLILISAVWMHLLPSQHAHAMRIVSGLLSSDGILVISLRHGPDADNRFHPVSTSELIQQAQHRNLHMAFCKENTPDSYRQEITWDTLVFRRQ